MARTIGMNQAQIEAAEKLERAVRMFNEAWTEGRQSGLRVKAALHDDAVWGRGADPLQATARVKGDAGPSITEKDGATTRYLEGKGETKLVQNDPDPLAKYQAVDGFAMPPRDILEQIEAHSARAVLTPEPE